MKKAMIVVAVLSVSALVKAQSLSIGPTGGFGHSWITNKNGDNQFNPAWNAGLSFIYSTKSNFGIGADVNYSSVGNKTDKSGIVNVTDLSYVRVPIKFIYFFSNYGSAVRPKIYAGPSFGFLTKANSTTDVSGVNVKTDISDNIKSFDFGVMAAAGLNFRLAPRTWLNTDLAFYQGLTDITKDNNSTQHNSNVGVNIGLLVGMGK